MTKALSGPMSVKRTSVGESGSVVFQKKKKKGCDVNPILVQFYFVSFFVLTGVLLAHQWLALYSTADGIDVETIECAWM